MSKNELLKKTKLELIELCRTKGINCSPNLNKDALVNLLIKNKNHPNSLARIGRSQPVCEGNTYLNEINNRPTLQRGQPVREGNTEHEKPKKLKKFGFANKSQTLRIPKRGVVNNNASTENNYSTVKTKNFNGTQSQLNNFILNYFILNYFILNIIIFKKMFKISKKYLL